MDKKEFDQFLENVVLQIFGLFDLEREHFEIREEEDAQIKIDVLKDDCGFLIGYHGKTLDSLETIIGLTLYYQTEEWKRVIIEVGDYREKKEAFLKQVAEKNVERSRFLQESVALSPMSNKERRFIHLLFEDSEEFYTESKGEGRLRHIVLCPKAKQ